MPTTEETTTLQDTKPSDDGASKPEKEGQVRTAGDKETEERSPRLTDDDVSWNKRQNLVSEVLSGEYHEVNPGQYHEINPGQYHEVNPGQYKEVNPGQYHEVNPGQYHEVNPGQYDALSSAPAHGSELDVKVDVVKTTDEAKIYNVQSRVEDFIIGEYGTISKSSGQTLQGVRYTAVADDTSGVDPNLIYETLVKYFPMAIKGSGSLAAAATVPT